MECTKENFDEVFALFCHYLARASFVSFDEEMTGIRLGAETEPVCVDGAAMRFRKMRRIAQHFSLLQVGLCLWERDSSSSSSAAAAAAVNSAPQWVARPFNFFVFPATAPAGINPIVRMETEAIEFNCKFDMDFNKWIRHGVPYVNAAQERQLHDHYFGTTAEQKQSESWESSPPLAAAAAEEANVFPSPAAALAASSAEPTPAPSPAPSPSPAPKPKRAFVGTLNDADREVVRVACAAIDAWLPTAAKELQLPECNSFLRAVLYQTIEERYPALEAESRVAHRRGGRSKTELFVTRYTVEERAARVDVHSPAARMRRDLQRHLGFRRVWLALVAARLPLVGHNCMFDLLFLYAAFEGELPDTLPAFKRELHARFPVIIDTKVFANHAVLNGDKLRLGSPFRAALVGEVSAAAEDAASSAVPICRDDEDCKQADEAAAVAGNASLSSLSSESTVSPSESSSAEPIRSGRGGRGGMSHHQSRRANHANAAKGHEATASVPARVSDTSLGSLFQQCKTEDAAAHPGDQSAPAAAASEDLDTLSPPPAVSEALAFSSRVRFGAGFAQYGGGASASARLHEAGFDAFATGFVLLHLGGEIVRFHERLRSSAAPSARPLQSPARWKYAGIPAHSDEQCTSWYPRLEQAVADFLSAASSAPAPPLSPPAGEHVAVCFDVHHPAIRACANYLFLLKSPFLLDLAGVRSLTGGAAEAGDDENEPRIDDCPEYVLSNASPLTQSPDVARLFGVASNQLWVQWLDKQSALVSFRKFCAVATGAESAALRTRAHEEQCAPTTEMRVRTLMGHIKTEAAAASVALSSAPESDALASHEPKPSLPAFLQCPIGGRDHLPTLRMDFPPPAASDAFVCSLLNDAAAVAHLPPLQRAWTLGDIAARREFQAAAIARRAGWFGVMRIGGGNPGGEADVDARFAAWDDSSAAEWVGICGLRAIDWAARVAEFGVLIAPAFQRRGLCAAALRECLSVAFDTLGMRRVVLRTSVANAPMRQCCVRFGLRCDGEIRLDDGSEFVQYTVEAAQH